MNKKTYAILKDSALPTKEQKDRMLGKVLLEARKYDASPAAKISRWITVYPWRFAFGVAAVQAALCTLIWGSGYTNVVLSIFGG
jgi:hypothetical protein